MANPTTYRSQRATVRRRDVKPELEMLPGWVHPQVQYFYDDWKMIRDFIAGEKEVKYEGQAYLPALDAMEDAEYAAYLDRATFYNFTGRTVTALVGTVFRRPYKIDNIKGPSYEAMLARFSKKNDDFQTFSRFVANELLTLSRVGVLVDLPATPSDTPKPYAVAYTAENILDWTVTEVDGREIVTQVVLREQVARQSDLLNALPSAKKTNIDADKTAIPNGGRARRFVFRYRVLFLDLNSVGGPVYKQRVYTNPKTNSDAVLGGPFAEFTPQVRGKTLDFIPFRFFGNFSNGPDVEKPMMIDIAQLNRSHYKSYAHLEHGRFYTGLPVYYVSNQSGESAGEYTIGPSVVWETSGTEKPGIIEFNGQGLKFLENALDQKESQAAALGGRMIGNRATASAESGDALKLKERNEQSLLLNATFSLDRGLTEVLRWMLRMADELESVWSKVTVEFNKDFLFDGIGSREFRAILAMYKEGVLPIDVVYHYMRKAEVIPEWMNIEEFKALLTKMDSFPNQPDAEARAEGFPNMKTKLDNDIKEQTLEQSQEEIDNAAKAAAETAKAAKIAAENPAPIAAPGAAPGKPGVGGPAKPAAKPAPKPAK